MGLLCEERAVLARIESLGPAMLKQVEAWSALNSGSRNLEGLARMAGVLEEALRPLGGRLSRRPACDATAIDAHGRAVPLRHGDNIHLIQRAEAPVRVLLTGHMDTVFGPEHPFQTVRRRADGHLSGPGVADMKGGIAVMLGALTAFEASSFAPRLGYDVVLNSDEEVSSPGSTALLREAAGRVQAGLTYEPALADGTLAGARKGSGNFSAVVRGRAAHAGRDPEAGRNALVAASELAVALTRRMQRRPGVSCNPARIDGGGANNIVPDLAVLRFNVRPGTIADQRWAEAAIAAVIAGVARRREVEITLHGEFGRPPKPLDANQARLFGLVRDCGSELGLELGWRETGGVCDGNTIAACGLPVVDTLGVRGGGIHSADEYMVVDSLVERARLSALILMRLAQDRLPAFAS